MTVAGRISAHSHPLANLVGVARFADEEANARVVAIRELFASQGKAFGWVTGPATRPTDLARHLVSAGLVKVDEMAGMALFDLQRRIDVPPRVHVREAGAEELIRASDLLAASYGMPVEIARMFGEAMARSRDRVRSRGYFAYLDDAPTPIAWSSLVYIPNSATVLLGGAATLPEHRGKGAYTRARRAQARGRVGSWSPARACRLRWAFPARSGRTPSQPRDLPIGRHATDPAPTLPRPPGVPSCAVGRGGPTPSMKHTCSDLNRRGESGWRQRRNWPSSWRTGRERWRRPPRPSRTPG
ncbi:MAG: hypothetical protein M3O91_03470 [Chloroflexota bacterium]|nr:hypothetical protein [Chloroflexota bacterium]